VTTCRFDDLFSRAIWDSAVEDVANHSASNASILRAVVCRSLEPCFDGLKFQWPPLSAASACHATFELVNCTFGVFVNVGGTLTQFLMLMV
jgi:hypothetical protein